MFQKGIFGDMFDFNHDGKLDTGEKITELMFLDHMMKEEEKKKEKDKEEE